MWVTGVQDSRFLRGRWTRDLAVSSVIGTRHIPAEQNRTQPKVLHTIRRFSHVLRRPDVHLLKPSTSSNHHLKTGVDLVADHAPAKGRRPLWPSVDYSGVAEYSDARPRPFRDKTSRWPLMGSTSSWHEIYSSSSSVYMYVCPCICARVYLFVCLSVCVDNWMTKCKKYVTLRLSSLERASSDK